VGRTARSFLILDIETVPDGELWAAADTPLGRHKPFPPTYAHRVVVIGCMLLDENYRLRRLGVIGDSGDEESILTGFSEYVERYRPALVTFNGRTFDLPVIVLRALRHGLQMAWYYQERGLRYRYSEEGHIDLCDWLAEHGAAKSSSLDALTRLIGLPGKLGVDGSQIEGLYRAGKIETIRDYCLADVTQTALLFLRFRMLQGVISRKRYTEAVGALLEELRNDERLEELMGAIDGPRLLAA